MDDGNDNEENVWVPFNPTSSTIHSLLGKRRAFSTISKYEWSLIAGVGVTLAIVLGISIYHLVVLPATSSDFTLAILLLINICFCFFYACHGVLFEQPFELYFLVITTVVMIVYSAMNFEVSLDELKAVKSIYISLVSPVIAVVGVHIGCGYKMSGNLLFRTVGSDPFMQSICFRAQLQCALLVFDAQAIYCCIVLIIYEAGKHVLEELLVLILGSLFTLVWMVLGYLTVRLESISIMAVFLVLCTVQPSYVVWRLVSAGLYQTESLQRNLVYASGVFFLLVHIYLITNTFMVYKNFGKGLREQIYGYRRLTPNYGATNEVANA